MIKKFVLSALFAAAILYSTYAQRYAVIDSKYILEKLPEYKDAQTKLDQFSQQWQQEIDKKSADLDKMYKEYDAEQVMLSDDLKKKRYGYEGDIFKKRQELIKPIQDRVYNAVQKLAVSKLYDFILDKSEGITVIFADPKLDRSDEVLKFLGVK